MISKGLTIVAIIGIVYLTKIVVDMLFTINLPSHQ